MMQAEDEDASEQHNRVQGLAVTIWVAIHEHFNPITEITKSWRMYVELRQRQTEIRLLQQAGRRVPYRLWAPKSPQLNGHRTIAWPSLISVIVACWLLIPLWLQFYTASSATPPPYNIFVPDLLMVFIALALCPALWVLLLIIFNPRWVQLWHISIARRRMAQHMSKIRKPFFSSRSAPRRLALLLGVAVYFPLLFAAAGVGNMPPALIVVSGAIGHARALPIVLFPITVEILAGLSRRRHRRRRLLPATEASCLESAGSHPA